ncbi:UvrABC system protein A [Longispora fulva]|uniref:UvrABC system protein A n=1 Tax=Longispora fulva TaxID=619741 RepID=A0A8J7KMN6_9ACTN|nr:excinuclease ABC subunit UvrA [Longispora fulva]MBG6134217.1 excinuclease ABC subunit A [Longispora fulva]GIG63109.1 UvrABC system protein A [Longispora fulva]
MSVSSPNGAIDVVGARTHNLRAVNVRLPHGQVIAFTGVSGSGKTSLAIDTLHAEAQLRYLEGLSPFVRQFITPKDRPRVDRITGLGVTLAVDQRRLNRSPQSTVATLTGLDDYLRLLYSRLPGLSADAGAELRMLSTSHFDRYSAEGSCRVCHGNGGTACPDPDKVITQPELPLFGGASTWFARANSPEHDVLPQLADQWDVDLAQPWRDLPARFRETVLHGTGDTPVATTTVTRTRRSSAEITIERNEPLRGALAEVERLYRSAGTESAKDRYAVYMAVLVCVECGGSGYARLARTTTLAGVTYPEIVTSDIDDLAAWATTLPDTLNPAQREVADMVTADLTGRLSLLSRLGLGHLQINRTAPSLSGGELQRTRTAAQLSTALTGVIFVLDEPTAGLHPADKQPLREIIAALRDSGNTVLLVEHDPDLIEACDWVVDIGPGAGRHGGRLVVAGTPAQVAATPESVTGRYLGHDGPRIRRTGRAVGGSWITLSDVDVHNVRLPELRVPLGVLTCLTGVSGSGKSSLLHGALGAGLRAVLDGDLPTTVGRVTGAERLTWIHTVDQQPIGRTPRSNPATYTKAFDAIRKLFAGTGQAARRGLTASSFSFNSPDGRCEVCTGYGRRLVEMHFLPDVWVTCETCQGRQFTAPVLEVAYKGLAVDEVLALTVEEAIGVFTEPPALVATLDALRRVGLGYLTLGQSASELSGGEAQRLKLATAILYGTKSRGPGLVILDEPITGLHPDNVQTIVDAFDLLIRRGHTVVIAEHDLHVAAISDWIIDMGPGAGVDGGRVVAQGTPREVSAAGGLTATYLEPLVVR